jgi:diguanylate cyclase (GGDEF)-like protein
MPDHPPSRAVLSSLDRLPLFAGVTVIGVATASLVGWAADVAALRWVFPGSISMAANTAWCFILLGAALVILRRPIHSTVHTVAAAACGVVVMLVGLLTLIEDATSTDLGIDHWFPKLFGTGDLSNRASPHAMVAFVCFGGWMLARALRWRKASAIISIGCVTAVGTAVIGFLLDARYLFGMRAVSGMAPHTLFAFVVLTFGVLAMLSNDDQTRANLIRANGPGGYVARKVVPAAAVGLVIFAWTASSMIRHDWLDPTEALASLAGASVVLIVGLLVWMGGRLQAVHRRQKMLETTLEQQALTDSLTHLLNRRGFENDLRNRQLLSRRYPDATTSVVLFDLDKLKAVNDQLGHPAGDVLLRGVAAALRAVSREQDSLARLGGDEFALILPHTDEAGATAVAERVVISMAEASWEHSTGQVKSTISAGIVSDPTGLAEVDELLACADTALYEAKAAGGNCLRVGAVPVPVSADPEPAVGASRRAQRDYSEPAVAR